MTSGVGKGIGSARARGDDEQDARIRSLEVELQTLWVVIVV